MVAAPRAIPVYFSSGAREGIGAVVIPGHGPVGLKTASINTARALWENGFQYFRITAEGARTLYADRSAEELRDLLANCRTEAEVNAITGLKKKNKALQTAGAERIQELQT